MIERHILLLSLGGGGLDFSGMTMKTNTSSNESTGSTLDFAGMTMKNAGAGSSAASQLSGTTLEFTGMSMKTTGSDGGNTRPS